MFSPNPDSREYQILATLESAGWSVDYQHMLATHAPSTAELTFPDGVPSLTFDGGYIHGGLNADASTPAADVLSQIEEALDMFSSTCPTCGAPGEEAPYTGDKQYCRKHWTTADKAQDEFNAKAHTS